MIRSLIDGARDLLARKLGRCARCMRQSLVGAVASDATLAVLVVASAEGWLLVPVALAAAAFSALFLAHVVAFTARVLLGARAAAADDSTEEPADPAVSRRYLFGLAWKASAAAVLLALFGRQQLVEARACHGVHTLDPAVPITSGAPQPTRHAARMALAAAAQTACTNTCADFNADCAPTTCVSKGNLGGKVTYAGDNHVGWTASMTLDACWCECA